MTTRYVWCLIIFNFLAIPAAITAYSPIYRRAPALPEDFEERLRQRAAAVVNMSESRALNTELVSIIASGDRALRSSIIVINWVFAFIVVIAVGNLMFIAQGAREFVRQQKHATTVA